MVPKKEIVYWPPREGLPGWTSFAPVCRRELSAGFWKTSDANRFCTGRRGPSITWTHCVGNWLSFRYRFRYGSSTASFYKIGPTGNKYIKIIQTDRREDSHGKSATTSEVSVVLAKALRLATGQVTVLALAAKDGHVVIWTKIAKASRALGTAWFQDYSFTVPKWLQTAAITGWAIDHTLFSSLCTVIVFGRSCIVFHAVDYGFQEIFHLNTTVHIGEYCLSLIWLRQLGYYYSQDMEKSCSKAPGISTLIYPPVIKHGWLENRRPAWRYYEENHWAMI